MHQLDPSLKVEISTTWDGAPVATRLRVRLELAVTRMHLLVGVDAPWHGDPAPLGPPGPLPGLWEHEVVELFLVGAAQRYLELEFGPYGHHLALELDGIRRVRRSAMPLDYRAERTVDGRWRGSARVPLDWMPPNVRAYNAHAIYGPAGGRTHLSRFPSDGRQPDFHALECCAPLPDQLREQLAKTPGS